MYEKEEESQNTNTLTTTQETLTQMSSAAKNLSQNSKPFAGLSFGVVGEMNSATQRQVINILESLGA